MAHEILAQWAGTQMPVRFSEPGPLHVPVRAHGAQVLDNGGDVVAHCFTAVLAHKLAELINRDAGAA